MVLFFYPKDFTFVCPTEIIAFSDHVDEFKKRGAEVIGASCDSAEARPPLLPYTRAAPLLICAACARAQSPVAFCTPTSRAQPHCDYVGATQGESGRDALQVHLAWSRTPRKKGGLGHMQIPLLADVDRRIAAAYGTLNAANFPNRGIYLIDPEARLASHFMRCSGVPHSLAGCLRCAGHAGQAQVDADQPERRRP